MLAPHDVGQRRDAVSLCFESDPLVGVGAEDIMPVTGERPEMRVVLVVQ